MRRSAAMDVGVCETAPLPAAIVADQVAYAGPMFGSVRTSRSVPRIVVALLLAGVLSLAGCRSGEIDRASLTTTTSFAPTHSAAIAEERERLGIPDDDGGVLCAALDEWSAQFPASVAATPAALAEVIGASADRFADIVVPAVPEDLREEAAGVEATIREAASSLQAVAGDERSLDQLVADGAVPGYVAYKALYDPAFTDTPDTPIVYRDALVAWIADPCGPKPLDSSWVPIDDGDTPSEPLGS